jgi:hypothetical protein
MLRQLVHLLEENEGKIDLVAIGRSLDAQPSAVAGMLYTLVRKGRVVEMGPDCGVCDSCGLSNRCVLSARRIKRYQIICQPTVSDQSPV